MSPSKKRCTDWGGARPGSGRKPVLKNARRVGVDLEGPDFERVKALAAKRGVSISQVVRDAVRDYLKRAKRN